MSASVQENGHGQHNGSTQPSEQQARRETEAQGQERRSEAGAEQARGRFGDAMKTPAAGATAAGVIAVGVASVFGVPEALIGAGAAYGVYLIARRRQAPR